MILPPRPTEFIYPDQLSTFERDGWWAQYKKNGQYNVIAVRGDRQLVYRNRHGEPHKNWQPSEALGNFFDFVLPDSQRHGDENDWVFCTELIEAKTPAVKGVTYIFDVLVANSQSLVGKTFAERQMLLLETFAPMIDDASESHYVLSKSSNSKVWLARNLKSNFRETWDAISAPEDEGLVLKDPAAELASFYRANSNSWWQVKCRKEHKNYEA